MRLFNEIITLADLLLRGRLLLKSHQLFWKLILLRLLIIFEIFKYLIRLYLFLIYLIRLESTCNCLLILNKFIYLLIIYLLINNRYHFLILYHRLHCAYWVLRHFNNQFLQTFILLRVIFIIQFWFLLYFFFIWILFMLLLVYGF